MLFGNRTVPGEIPAGGEVAIPVVFRPGLQSGKKRVEFTVLTDQVGDPLRRYALTATLTPEMEVAPIAEGGSVVAAGRVGKQRLRIICRRKGDDGLGAPSAIAGLSPASVRFIGPTRTRAIPGEIVESLREAEVDLPASAEPGFHRMELRLSWADQGRSELRQVTWMVTSQVRARPPALMLATDGQGTTTREVTIESTGEPFRVLGVHGEAIAEGFRAPPDRRRVHRLRLPLVPTAREGVTDLRIETDHPDQPFLKVSILTRRDSTAPIPGGK